MSGGSGPVHELGNQPLNLGLCLHSLYFHFYCVHMNIGQFVDNCSSFSVAEMLVKAFPHVCSEAQIISQQESC